MHSSDAGEKNAEHHRRVMQKLKKLRITSINRETRWQEHFIKPFQKLSTFVDVSEQIKEPIPAQVKFLSRGDLDPSPITQRQTTTRFPEGVAVQADNFISIPEVSSPLQWRTSVPELSTKERLKSVSQLSKFLVTQLSPDQLLETKDPFYNHLGTKLDEEHISYRPTRQQRARRRGSFSMASEPHITLAPSSNSLPREGQSGTERLYENLNHLNHRTKAVMSQLRALKKEIYNELNQAKSRKKSNDDHQRRVKMKMTPLQANPKVRAHREKMEIFERIRNKHGMNGLFVDPIPFPIGGLESGLKTPTYFTALPSPTATPVATPKTHSRRRLVNVLDGFKSTMNNLMANMESARQDNKVVIREVVGFVEREGHLNAVGFAASTQTNYVPASLAFTPEDRETFDRDRAKHSRLQRKPKLKSVSSAAILS
eukprot:TRINITY_DN5703_c0_g4_i3.p1 TRINITY_DN5703_c0_g4~~TRINITY_DN5703_c0_g4_i3.p1  ORF type:complete len:427 (-),score=77.87 TRINITY_DN5703_c0_g4_i3:56-1336(-)